MLMSPEIFPNMDLRELSPEEAPNLTQDELRRHNELVLELQPLPNPNTINNGVADSDARWEDFNILHQKAMGGDDQQFQQAA